MKPSDIRYKNFLQILQEKPVSAVGCTEPIAIAYGAAKARETLGASGECFGGQAATRELQLMK